PRHHRALPTRRSSDLERMRVGSPVCSRLGLVLLPSRSRCGNTSSSSASSTPKEFTDQCLLRRFANSPLEQWLFCCWSLGLLWCADRKSTRLNSSHVAM